MAPPSHIFIGGSYRTGTDLMRNILNSADDIAISGETHFFGNPSTPRNIIRNGLNGSSDAEPWGKQDQLRGLVCPGCRQEFARVADPTTDDGARKLVDHIYGLERSFWQWLHENVDRDEFLQRVLASDRSEKAIFDLLMEFYAAGKPIRGEKTPAHIFCVPMILDWFPDAKFIHMIRDPRGVFASQRSKLAKIPRATALHKLFRLNTVTYEAFMALQINIHWTRVVQLHQQYQRLFPSRYIALKFEDLLSKPEAELRKLCTFLDIDFSDKMLERRVVNTSFKQTHQGVAGFDASVATRWKDLVGPRTKRWFTWSCEKRLVELGYPLSD
jgi:hypothetical protein